MANSVNFMSQHLWLVEREKRMLIYRYNKGTEQTYTAKIKGVILF